MLQIM